MNTIIDSDDRIELTVDLPKHQVSRGQQGKVVSIRQPNQLFEVEFENTIIPVSIRQMKKVG